MKRLCLASAAFAVTAFSGISGPARADAGPGSSGQSLVKAEIPPAGVTQELRLKDGSRLYGRVEGIEGERIVFRTVSGQALELSLEDIAALGPKRGGLFEGEFVPDDPNQTRLFFGPTARSLKRGKGYLGVYELGMPFVQVGVTDRVTVGGGTPLYFGSGERFFWLTPKLQLYDGDRTKVAAGVLHLFGSEETGSLGIAYGVATRGSANAAVTVGFGLGYVRGESKASAGIVMLGAESRVNRNVKLVTENWFWKGGHGFVSGGVRFFGERLSADLGLVAPIGSRELFAFPIVNFVWAF